MISLATVQRLLVLSAVAWLIFPVWGAGAFAATWVLLSIGSMQRVSKARKLIDASPGALGTFDEETNAHLRKYALTYVWPTSAEKWGTTWQLGGLLSVLLIVGFIARAMVTLSPWLLIYVVPLAIGVVTGGGMARRIKITERVRDDLKAIKSTHDSLSILSKLKTGAGQWPPSPPPEGDV